MPTESIDAAVAHHYSAGNLLVAIEASLTALGKSSATVTVADLSPVDEFHIGGRSATTDLCRGLAAGVDDELLDIGCGIGGTARFIASTIGCRVTGLDLTPEYVEVARQLTEWTSLTNLCSFEQGNALEMPFADASFDGATQLHVGMNIADKAALFSEIFRVLRPGSSLALFDIMQTSSDEFDFPVPWATNDSMSFVADLPSYRTALDAAGFEIESERNRRDFAVAFFAALRERAADRQNGPAPIGLHIIMGQEAPQKIANMMAAISSGTLAPVEMICRKPNDR